MRRFQVTDVSQEKRASRSQVLFVCLLLSFPSSLDSAETILAPADYPKSLERELQTLLANGTHESSDPCLLFRLAALYLDIGDELYGETSKRRAAYEEGARLARRALDLQEASADAHYLYAANLGSAAQLKGVMASAFTVNELKTHVRRALELKGDHAPALHMMGMMLEELPWLLGGDAAAALTYLNQAVVVDPQYTHARLDLAKAFLKRRNVEAAREQLSTIVNREIPREPSVSERRYRQEATQLLESLMLK